MKRNRSFKVLALVASLACLLVWAPSQAAASARSMQRPQAAASTAEGGAVSGTFSKKDLMVLVAGATCLVAFGVGFRRMSAPLE